MGASSIEVKIFLKIRGYLLTFVLREILIAFSMERDMTDGMSLEVETTYDGSVTLYRDDIDEHYHSVKGALAESLHVYIDCGWRQAAMSRSRVTVFEVGFGTGLNAALTAKAAVEERIATDYYAVELYPLSDAMTSLLRGHQPAEYSGFFEDVNSAAWGEEAQLNPYFRLTKINADFLSMDLPRDLDAVYFDAFAPEKQPEMWGEDVFRKLYESMAPGGVLTTYCAKGAVRRMLQAVGFTVERLPGPKSGKREILRATK